MHYIINVVINWLNQLIDDNDVLSQVIQAHFYLKRTEVMAQCEEWIAQVGQYCNDKRVGRSMLHHWKNLKVRSEGEKGKREAWVHRDNYDGDDGEKVMCIVIMVMIIFIMVMKWHLTM